MTVATPTTAGSRSCPTRFPSSRGTTPRSSAPKSAAAIWGIDAPDSEFHLKCRSSRSDSISRGAKIEIAALIAAGSNADNSITIQLGYPAGDREIGRVGARAGVNVFPLTTSTGQPFVRMGAQRVTKLTRPHGSRSPSRRSMARWKAAGADITRESNFEQYQKTVTAAPSSEDGQYFKKMGMDGALSVRRNVSLGLQATAARRLVTQCRA